MKLILFFNPSNIYSFNSILHNLKLILYNHRNHLETPYIGKISSHGKVQKQVLSERYCQVYLTHKLSGFPKAFSSPFNYLLVFQNLDFQNCIQTLKAGARSS